MKLRHATPLANMDSIVDEGLAPMYAVTDSDKKYIWLHTPGRTPWALAHTSRRKQTRKEEIVILEVSVPRRWLTRAWPGIWKCPRVIAPARLKKLEGKHHTE